MSAETEDSEECKLVKRHVDQLGEHFDSVYIFVTKTDTDSIGPCTVNVAKGNGNFFASFGLVKRWIIQQEEIMRTGGGS